MNIRRLPNLTPMQVIRLQDALLSNADTLLTSAVTLLDVGNISLARSLAILGLEESGKAIAIHNRRVAMNHLPSGETFRCEELDLLWGSHQRKLETVHQFLVDERYWFGEGPSDPEENAASLGAIKSWARRQDHSKQRGFYVELSKTGEVMAPSDVTNEEALRDVIASVHQIGWQLRLGEHIEGKSQDQREHGSPGFTEEEIDRLSSRASDRPRTRDILAKLKRALLEGAPGEPLPNPEYRFNREDAKRTPFSDMGKPGYEAETRELLRLMDRTRDADEENAQ